MTMKSARGTERDVDDLGPSRAPRGMPQARWSRGMQEGRRESKHLAWYRGQQSGHMYEVLALQKMGYTLAAKRLQKSLGLDDRGNRTLG